MKAIRFFSTRPILTVFIVNFCIMTLELVAGRLIAPHVGVSLYTWTAIIGIILAGMTVGNYFGGKAADQKPSPNLVGTALIGASIFSLLSLSFVSILGSNITRSAIPYPIQVIIITLAFFLPAMMLGAISPAIVKLSIKNLKKTGATVGKIYAAASFGSIIGTYTTGFFLIPAIGVKLIIILTAIILLTIGLSYTRLTQLPLKKPHLILIVFFMLLITNLIDPTAKCDQESNYYCIRIKLDPKTQLKRLTLDKLVHSITDLNDPQHIEYDYEKLFALFYQYFVKPSSNINSPAVPHNQSKYQPQVLFLGGGAYTLPRMLIAHYTNPQATVVEIDPKVSQVAFREFDMPQNSSVKTFNIDARMYLKNLSSSQKYTIIYGDAFSDLSIPYHLTTLEFTRSIASHLEPRGYYVANVIDTLNPGLFLKAYARTLSQTFKYVYLFQPGKTTTNSQNRYTYVLVCGQYPLNFDHLHAALNSLNYSPSIINHLNSEKFKHLLDQPKKHLILTDDYAPVDNLIAPVFARSSTPPTH